MIAPATMDALADVARALGFEFRRASHAVPLGVDFDRAKEQVQFALMRGGQFEFDGTSRECAAFLIGWRDLRLRVLGELHVVDVRIAPEVSGHTPCRAHDAHWRQCLLHTGHDGPHLTLVKWQEGP